MPGLLDSIKNFATKQRIGLGNAADTSKMLSDLDNKYGTNVLAFMDRAATPPPITPNGMQDSSQLLRQTNAAAGIQDASQGLNGSLPSLSTPVLTGQLSQADPRRGILGDETEEERFFRLQRETLQQGYEQLPSAVSPPKGLGFGEGYLRQY